MAGNRRGLDGQGHLTANSGLAKILTDQSVSKLRHRAITSGQTMTSAATVLHSRQSTNRTPDLSERRRTQAERRQAARESILGAALVCFNRNGYHETSMADIAKEAGVSKGLLHYHFDTKENLAMAVEAQLAEIVFQRITQNVQPLTPSVKQASRALDSLWQDIVSGRQFIPIAIDLASRAMADSEKRVHFAELLNGHVELLRLGVRRILGPIADDANFDERTIADMLLVVMAGLAIGNVFIDDQRRFQSLFDAFKKMLITSVIPDRIQQEESDADS